MEWCYSLGNGLGVCGATLVEKGGQGRSIPDVLRRIVVGAQCIAYGVEGVGSNVSVGAAGFVFSGIGQVS